MFKYISFLLAFVFSLSTLAQNPTRQYISHQFSEYGCEIQVSDGKYLLAAYTDQILEVSFIPKGDTTTLAASHAVVLPTKSKPFLYSIVSDSKLPYEFFNIENGDFHIEVRTSPQFELLFYYKDQLLTSEARGYYFNETPRIEFNIKKEEQLMGAGARALGMNRRGYRLQLYNRAHYGYETHSELMNFTMPIVISDQYYAIHFDNPQIGFLDLDSKKEDKLTYEVIGGPMRYQIIAANDWHDLSENMTQLLGRQPMPARWTLGNFASRFGYHSQTEAQEVVAAFKKEQIPLDAIVFDLYWFGKDIQGTLGNFEFFKDSFPNAEQMIADFRSENVKTILITEPFVLTTSKKWSEADRYKLLGTDTLGNSYRYDFYFGNTGLIDLYKPAARTWFWDIYKNLHGYGVAGFWGDLGEPEVHPAKLKHGDQWADEVHNIYGHDWARLVYEGYRKDFPTERPFILMRAGYSGSQRYGMVPWSGDVNRTWGGLKSQMEISLQMGLQGMAYMHSDLGGFAGANDDPELYVRWLQYGVFQPVFRPHAQQEVASEAVFKDAKTKALAKAAIELRYQLLPYNYSLAFENHQKGTPLMRPIFMEFPQAKWSFTESETYMWGSAFLVHAITDSMNLSKESVYKTSLPVGSSWFNFHSGKLVYSAASKKGPHEFQIVETPKTLQQIPVFVRAGAFIPMTTVVQSTEQYRDTAVVLHVYLDPKSKDTLNEFVWYEDDGASFDAAANGLSKKLWCQASTQNEVCKLQFKAEIGEKVWEKYFHFSLLIHAPSAPKEVYVNGEKVKFDFDKKSSTLRLSKSPKLRIAQNSSLVELKW
jgi:alpha-glucosidase (family GH31 glycosyl hydrolase)